MATPIERLKAATSAIFGTGAFSQGDTTPPRAGENIYDMTFDGGIARSIVNQMDAGDLYATQPHLRTVVSFIARNGAQLGRHVYTKSEDGRVRVDDSSAAKLMTKPNEYMTGYDLFNMLFSELALHDMAIWVPSYRNGRWVIDPIPGEWVTGAKKADAFQMAGYRIKYPNKPEPEFLPANLAVVFRGYSPSGFSNGSSPVRSLQGILEEQVSALDFRRQMWRRGGRVGLFMTRPADAPVWSSEAKSKFIQAWRNSWSGDGANAGSTPLLEDGMKLERVGFNAKEEQWLEAATLALSTVASAYHVPPSMVGASDGSASFASVKEFRKMLYTETMGPSIAQVEDTINTFLFPMIGESPDNYLELNIAEKMQGDFEEQAQVLFQAIGGPYMTPNEGRTRANLPLIEGGDVLLAPLNMGAAGNNGPTAGNQIDSEDPAAGDPSADTPTGPKSTRRDVVTREGVKAAGQFDEDDLATLAKDLDAYFGRQKRAVVDALGSKDPSWWNQKKWNRELSGVLQPHLTSLSVGAAKKTAGAKGLNPDDYSVGRTTNFLKAVADNRADAINASTRDALAVKIAAAEPGEASTAVTQTFDETYASRSKDAAKTMGTMIGAWAVTEVARQLMPDQSPKKTWIASGLPNSRHADMDGETVDIDAPFSNGANWPGDPVLGAEGTANCECGVDISTE